MANKSKHAKQPAQSKQPTLLKHYYSAQLVRSIAIDCKKHYKGFESIAFEKAVIGKNWETLELKERMHRIADYLGHYLPSDFKSAVDILLKVAANYSGLAHMCFPDFVEKFGQSDFETSMMALEMLTEGSSSEFAVRPFILLYPKATMTTMARWSQSENYHVRRLASEGCRPRLPWAMALPDFKKNPAPVLAIILDLINDDELYVRRSVANNLNDISKDNPLQITDIASKYLGRSKNIDWVIKHACRGLLKQGNPEILTLFGFSPANHVTISNFTLDQRVKLEEHLNFSFELKTSAQSLGKLRVEFIIDFMKSNGKTAEKIFKICEGQYDSHDKIIKKYFSFKKISTRKYYTGEHQLHLVINGIKVESRTFLLRD